MQGESLAHYEILRPLGRGGMGEVWVARDTRLNREVALKLLPPELSDDPERLARFEREAKTLAALNHPNIVTIYSVEEADGRRFMTMELVSGRPLGEHIPEGGFGPAALLDLAVPLAEGLAAAHARGVQHRDLKPANIMVTEEGRVKILDFGLAQIRRSTAGGSEAMTQMLTGELTGEGRILGTVPYMSPEQAEGRPLDHRSDIFSLGILLYEMASGVRPFDGETSLSTLTAILRDQPPSLSEARHDMPVPVGRVVQRALEKKPENRYQSTTDLARDLADIKRDMDTGEALASGLYTRTHSQPDLKPAGSRRPIIGGVAAAAALAVIVALTLWTVASPESGGDPTFNAIPTRADLPGVIVLYFDNISSDPELEWLRTGLTDMLVTDLSQAPNLRVVGTDRLYTLLSDLGRLEDRSTSFDVVREVAERARVGTAVVGSFARAGEQIRINARVQDAATGDVLASESVSGDAGDLFALVDQLTERISENFAMPAMSAEMTEKMTDAGMGDRSLREVTTDSVAAYRLYNEAEMLKLASREEEAEPLLERAIELDPDFAMAHAKLSVVRANMAGGESGLAAAERAFELSDKLPPRERYYIRGRYYSLRNETTQQAIDAYTRLLELFPDDTAARNNLAIVLQNLERYEEAVGHFETLRAQGAPFAGLYGNLAGLYATLGRNEDAVEVMREFVDKRPDVAGSRLSLATALARTGQFEEAYVQLDRAEELGAGWMVHQARAGLYAAQDRWDEFDSEVEQLLAVDAQAARLQGYRIDAMRSLLFGRRSRFAAIVEEASAEIDLPMAAAEVLNLRISVALQFAEGARALELNEQLAALEDPTGSWQQAIRVNELIGNAVAGNVDEAYAARDAFWDLIARIPAPERLRTRIRHQIDGALAWAVGDGERAAEELQAAVRLMPRASGSADGWADIYYFLGLALMDQGRDDEAAVAFRRIAELSLPRLDVPTIWVESLWYLGRYHAARDETRQARDYYERFLRYWGDGEVHPDKVAAAREYLR